MDKCGQLLIQLPPKLTSSTGHALCQCLMYENVCILSDGPHLPNPCFSNMYFVQCGFTRLWSLPLARCTAQEIAV